VLHHALASGLAIKLAAGMKMNLRQRAGLTRRLDAEATPGVVEVKENTAVFPGDGS
jgi:hypothetical protein